MSDLRDPAIKLFGRTIPLEEPDKDACEITNPEQSTEPNSDHSLDPVHGEPNSDQSLDLVHGEPNSDQSLDQAHGEPNKPETEPDSKTLKKPDKILPCPRCNSMETKFCYYNNYNVNQPRHFCKKCQRYWTAGGTMRNVPVGAGRRKNKHLNRPQLFGTDASESVPVPPNGSVVKFGTGTDMPLCESMVSGLTIKENRSGTGTSTCTGTISSEENITAVPVPPVQFYPGAPFVYPWNTGTIPVPLPVQPGTGFCPPAVPFPFVPASFWAFGWGPPQWVGSPASSSTSTCSTGTGSPTLGKHSRDGTGTGTVPEQSEKNLWVPKTLRIDDPEEAAKSSIWDTLGIKPEERGVLGAFRGKNEVRGLVRSRTSQVLHANPAALSRSQSFQESS